MPEEQASTGHHQNSASAPGAVFTSAWCIICITDAGRIPVEQGETKMDQKEKDKPKVTGRFGKGNPGKPKGAITKTTRTAKEAIAAAADALGGAERLTEWAQEDPANERVFWGTIYPKLLPLQVTGEGGGPISMSLKLKFVKPDGS